MPHDLTASTLILFLYQINIIFILILIILIDLDFQIIPDSLNIYLGLLLLVFNIMAIPWNKMIWGAVLGFSIPFVVTWAFYLLRGKIGLGGGDIKLYTVLGLALLPYGIIQNIFLSCLLGGIMGVTLIGLRVIDRNTPIAFGPFICFIAFFQLLVPDRFFMVMGHYFFILRFKTI